MPYVDEQYYNNVFRGEPVDDADFPSLLERASEIVEEMCMYRIKPELMDAYGTEIQNRIKKAVCAQIECSDMDNGTDLQSAGLGKFSYTKSSGITGSSKQSIYSPRSMRILAPTGLLYRGGGQY